ncbi:MAG: sugar phosphate isomerase/epimerase [Bacteroidetes bacterium]|nr:MAG: sugar phosphate isomerase/epimerase [Bacteroidota bacterium]
MRRRTFLQTSGYLAVGSLLASRARGCDRPEKIDQVGLQLYTIRDAMQRDPDEALRQVAALGYDYVEGAGYSLGNMYDRSPRAFKSLLDEHGLQMPSGHVDWKIMRDDPQQAVAEAKAMGQYFIVVPWLPEEMRTAAGYQELARVLNEAGGVCQKAGLQLAYHNHDFEFTKMVAARRPYDLLLAETDPELVKFELDFYWITRAGSDYKRYFAEHPGRFPLWHVKDMDATPEQFFAAVGNGVIDWPAVFAQQEQAGMQYFFVEQDQMRPGKKPLEELAVSIAYLEKMKY